MRPADGVETVECWQIAMQTARRPSLLAFSRQEAPPVRTTHTNENLSAKGAYELIGDAQARVSLLATGTEVALAVKARELLAADGIKARVVSMPCWALFEQQPEDYRKRILGPGTAKVGIEAAARLGWDRYIGPDGAFIGMHSFGASGPWKDVYKRFGITAEAVADAARKKLK
jgi:transketolase